MDVKISLPLLPLRDIVVFPSMVIPLFVGRDKSISALNEVMKKDKKIILATQKNSEVDDPKKTDIFTENQKKIKEKIKPQIETGPKIKEKMKKNIKIIKNWLGRESRGRAAGPAGWVISLPSKFLMIF